MELEQWGFLTVKAVGTRANGKLKKTSEFGTNWIGLHREKWGFMEDTVMFSSWNLAGHNVKKHKENRDNQILVQVWGDYEEVK